MGLSKNGRMILVVLLAVALAAVFFGAKTYLDRLAAQNELIQQTQVRDLVTGFGKGLQMVSLQAPEDMVKESIKENYGNSITLELLTKWERNVSMAPGRIVSSPWPDRIEIQSVEKNAEDLYTVIGEIIEITSADQSTGGIAAKRPITLTVKKTADKWLIDEVAMEPYTDDQSVSYSNRQYGFTFKLPEGWRDYTILIGKWEGIALSGEQRGKVIETGPVIEIRHPAWTASKPRQDIPVMVFTDEQWQGIESESYSVGAAPMAPSELGRNFDYVFALPARYNYAFPEGFEEVEAILADHPLQPIEPDNGNN